MAGLCSVRLSLFLLIFFLSHQCWASNGNLWQILKESPLDVTEVILILLLLLITNLDIIDLLLSDLPE